MAKGKIYFVGTPIGNLSDITLRALETLKNADIIAAEDTRNTIKLLNHYEIKKPLISYHEHNERERSLELIEKINNGMNIALVTDAGMPGISDPGFVMVKNCIDSDISFEVIPGPCAFTTALLYSGLSTSQFIFIGFIPTDNKKREEELSNLKGRGETLIFYEAPHRLMKTLCYLKEFFCERSVSVCRELTKIHEESIRGSFDDVIGHFEENQIKGEFVIVVEGKSREAYEEEKKLEWEGISMEEHIKKYINEGLNKKEAVKMVAKDRNIQKSEVYKHSFDIK